MRILLLVAVLAVESRLPIYGQRNASKATGNQYSSADAHQPEGQAGSPIVPRNASTVNEPTADGQEDRKTHESDSYLKMLVAANNLPNLILAGIGIVGVVVALRTLSSIKRQTTAIVESQRPRILAKAHGNPNNTIEEPLSPRVEMDLLNRGLTAAHDFVVETWIEVIPDPFSDFSLAADHHKSTEPVVMYPGSNPLIVNIPIRNGITLQQRASLRNRTSHVCIRIQIRYRDSFGSRKPINFGFVLHADGLGYLPKYNSDPN